MHSPESPVGISSGETLGPSPVGDHSTDLIRLCMSGCARNFLRDPAAHEKISAMRNTRSLCSPLKVRANTR